MPYRQPRIRVSAMIWHDDKLVMIRQGRADHPRWMLPGGGVEAGESLTDALRRELREEIDLVHEQIGRMVAVVESIAPPTNASGRHLVHMIFHTTCQESDLHALHCADPDIHEWRLCTREELMQIPIHPPIATYLSEWTSTKDFAYFGPLWAP